MSVSLPIKVRSVTDVVEAPTKAAQIAPYVNENEELVVFNSYEDGSFKGIPTIKSWVTWLTDKILMVEVEGQNSKTRTRQSTTGGVFYFVRENGRWTRHYANYGPIQDVLGGASEK
jgi:hypothetical protein